MTLRRADECRAAATVRQHRANNLAPDARAHLSIFVKDNVVHITATETIRIIRTVNTNRCTIAQSNTEFGLVRLLDERLSEALDVRPRNFLALTKKGGDIHVASVRWSEDSALDEVYDARHRLAAAAMRHDAGPALSTVVGPVTRPVRVKSLTGPALDRAPVAGARRWSCPGWGRESSAIFVRPLCAPIRAAPPRPPRGPGGASLNRSRWIALAVTSPCWRSPAGGGARARQAGRAQVPHRRGRARRHHRHRLGHRHVEPVLQVAGRQPGERHAVAELYVDYNSRVQGARCSCQLETSAFKAAAGAGRGRGRARRGARSRTASASSSARKELQKGDYVSQADVDAADVAVRAARGRPQAGARRAASRRRWTWATRPSARPSTAW